MRGLDRARCNVTNAYKIVDRVQCMLWNLKALMALADWLAAPPRLAPAYYPIDRPRGPRP